MVAALVFFATAQRLRTMARDIHLTAEDGLEGFKSLLLASFIDATNIVVELLDAEHVTMVSDGHTLHTIGNSLVNQSLDARLAIQYRIICMYV